MNAKIDDKQKSDDRTSEEQTSDDLRLTKINSCRTAWRSLLTKFFADENFLLYSLFSVLKGQCHDNRRFFQPFCVGKKNGVHQARPRKWHLLVTRLGQWSCSGGWPSYHGLMSATRVWSVAIFCSRKQAQINRPYLPRPRKYRLYLPERTYWPRPQAEVNMRGKYVDRYFQGRGK